MKAHMRNNHTLLAAQRKQRTEIQWLKWIRSQGFGIDHDHDARIDHCSLSSSSSTTTIVPQDQTPKYSSRIDFFLTSEAPLRSYLTFVEIDERYHSDRCLASEFARMQENLASLHRGNYPNRPHLVIRVNPDAFKVDGVSSRVSTSRRKEVLLEVLRTDWTSKIVSGLTVNLIYLFYPTSEQRVLASTVSENLPRIVSSFPVTNTPTPSTLVDSLVTVRLPTLFEENGASDDYDLGPNDIANARLFRTCVLYVQ
jgi:hypothetical protein